MRTVSEADIVEVAGTLGLGLGDTDIALYRDLVDGTLDLYRSLAGLPDPAAAAPDRSWQRPAPGDNPLNGWHARTDLRGTSGGLLAGRTVAIKDNIMVAGLPMSNGTATLRDFIADFDATVVTRVLAHGATVTGTANCEAYCLSCSSFTGASSPVLNPFDATRSAGGSSSGAAALVASGAVDMALGTDQGGSVRMPSSFCGTYGLKPTFGLVPYTGAMPMEVSIDHIGPITRTVEDNARLLEAIAGDDSSDPRQRGVGGQPYSALLTTGLAGVRIGVVREGFGHANSEPEVDAQVRAAALRFEALGAELVDISIPEHATAPLLWFPLATGGATYGLLTGGGYGLDGNELHSLRLIKAQARWRESAAQWPMTVRVFVMAGLLAQHESGALPFARAANLRRALRGAVDHALTGVDLLLLPTTPHRAPPLPSGGDTAEQFAIATRAASNTLSFNLTGHPALSLPCGLSCGLPVGAMLVARRNDEPSLYRAALGFEAAYDWTRL